MIDKNRIENAVREILIAIGENPDREGLEETPKRISKMYEEIFAGLHTDPKDFIKIFHEDCTGDMVVVKDIQFYSMCEHHLLPFMGKAHVVYIPNEKGEILGLSKIGRIVDILSKKPQLQERLNTEIAETIENAIHPLGVSVVIEAEHLCMTMRGVRKPGSKTVTSSSRGLLKSNTELRKEAQTFIEL